MFSIMNRLSKWSKGGKHGRTRTDTDKAQRSRCPCSSVSVRVYASPGAVFRSPRLRRKHEDTPRRGNRKAHRAVSLGRMRRLRRMTSLAQGAPSGSGRGFATSNTIRADAACIRTIAIRTLWQILMTTLPKTRSLAPQSLISVPFSRLLSVNTVPETAAQYEPTTSAAKDAPEAPGPRTTTDPRAVSARDTRAPTGQRPPDGPPPS